MSKPSCDGSASCISDNLIVLDTSTICDPLLVTTSTLKASTPVQYIGDAHPRLLIRPTTDTSPLQNPYLHAASKRPPTRTPSRRRQLKKQDSTDAKPSIEVFLASTEEDKEYFVEINQLILMAQNHIQDCYINYKTSFVGTETALGTKELLTSVHLVLVLMSRSFLASDFSRCQQIQDAVKRAPTKFYFLPIRVQPIAPNFWKRTIFKDLEVFPENGKALSELKDIMDEVLNQLLDLIIEKIDMLRLNNGTI